MSKVLSLVSRARARLIVGTAFIVACGGAGTEPTAPPKPLTIVSGAGVSDTVNAKPLQALIVEVRANGVLRPATVVRFEVVPTTNTARRFEPTARVARISGAQYGSFVADSTDASGRARVLVQMGTIAGAAGIAISVPDLGLADTAWYTVKPGNPAKLVLGVRDTVVLLAATYKIGAASTDIYGNARTDTPTYTAIDATVSSVDGTGTVRGIAVGRGRVAISAGTFSDTARMSVVPDLTIVGVTDDRSPRSIAMAKLDGSGFKRLTDITSEVSLPSFDPTGSKVVFYEFNPSYDAKIFTVDMSGTRTQLTLTGPTTMFFPTYAADGSIFFSAQVGGSWDVWRAPAVGGQATRMTTSANFRDSYEPDISADGRLMTFRQDGIISVMDLASKVITSLKLAGDFPKFSPDGSQIAFISSANTLVIINADGGAPRTLGGRAYDTYSAPHWSPDGKWILIRASSQLELVRASNFDIVALPTLKLGQASFKP